MTESELNFLDGVIERSKMRRRTWFGERKTTMAEAAEIVLVAFAPALLAEVRRLRNLERATSPPRVPA
jgi:hypothetical protein